MTLEQQQTLERELDGAMKSGDAHRVQCAHANIILAIMDCQRKTADRVKAAIAEREAEKQRRAGAKWAVGLLVGGASVAGPIASTIICKLVGILW